MGHSSYRLALGILGAALLLGACTVKKQAAPSLTGPSELSLAISIAVSPDVLAQDGASQSLVTITARDSNGQPIRNLSLRAEISVGGTITDFGTLSARNVVTDTNGRATLIYTAPAPAAVAVSSTDVEIRVTPTGLDFANETPRQATIRLVPSGFLPPPFNSVTPRFTVNPPAPADHEVALFDASASTSTNGPIATYVWSFGDGGSATGITAQHSFNSSGTFVVRLTVTDIIGATNSITQSMTVGDGTPPVITPGQVVVSPSSGAIVGQQINFNASQARPAPGRTLRSFVWDFGDGTPTASGVQVSHVYSTPGSYTVLLTVSDDAGRSTAVPVSVTVATDAPVVPNPTVTPTPPVRGQAATFDASSATPAPGRTLVSYQWTFANGTPATASGVNVSHVFDASGATIVQLTVTDNTGRSTTRSFTVTVVDPPPAVR